MIKTMIAIFALPLVAKADIHIDLKPLKEMVAQHQGVPQMDTAQIQAAVQTIQVTAQMNASYNAPVAEDVDAPGQKTDQEHLAELLANIEALSKQAAHTN